MKVNMDKIKRAFEENPVAFLAAAGTVLYGVSKCIEATGSYSGSKAYARQVDYRIANHK